MLDGTTSASYALKDAAYGRPTLVSFIAIRALALLLLLNPFAVGHCQQPTAASVQPAAQAGTSAPGSYTSGSYNSWDRVRALSPGTSLEIKRRDGGQHCTVRSVDEDSLTCGSGKHSVIPRTDIVSAAIAHRGRSALILGGVGAGIGAATVKIVAEAAFQSFFNGHAKGSVYAGGAAVGALVFAPIGASWDVTRSTIYRAP